MPAPGESTARRPFTGSWPVAAAFALALLSLVLGAVVGFLNLQRLSRDRWALVHTQSVQVGLQSFITTLVNAETGQRGYLLTGESSYLAPYEDAVRQVDSSLGVLRQLVADNREQVRRLDGIDSVVTRKLDELRQTVMLLEAGDEVGAMAVLRSGEGQALMDSVRTGIGRMQEEESRLVEVRTTAVRRSHHALLTSILVTAAIGLFLVVLAFQLSRRQRRLEREATEAMAAQRERLRTTLSSIGDGVITTDEHGIVTGLNPVAESLTRWSAADATGRHVDDVFRIIDRYSRAPVTSPAMRALREGIVVELANSVLLVRQDGSEIPMDDSAAPIRAADGTLIGSVLVFRDVTERQRTRDRLREIHTRLESTLAVGEVGTWEFDVGSGRIRCDSNCAKVVGALEGEADGMPLDSFTRGVDPSERKAMEQAFGHSLTSGQPFQVTHRIVEPDGKVRWVALRGRVERDDAGNVVRLPGVVVDITAQRQAEDQARRLLATAAAANAKFRAFFEQGDLFAGIMSVDGTVVETNRLAWEACGFTPEQIKGKKFWDGPWWAPSPALQERIRAAWRMAAAGHVFRAELPYYVASGEQRMVDLRITPIRDADEAISFLAPTGVDITDRKRMEADRDKLVSLAENSTDFIAMYDLDFIPVYVNQAGREMVGLEGTAQAQHTPIQEFFFPEDRPGILSGFLPAIRTAGQGEIEVRLRHFRTGEGIWVLYRLFTLFDVAGERIGYATVARDVSERKRLEQELRSLAANLSETDRRKDEFLATLAHELRNPLAPLRNGLEIIRISAGDPEATDKARAMMTRQLQQMVHLVDDLLDVNRINSGKLELRTETVELGAILLNAVETSRPVLEAKRHVLDVEIPAGRILVHADVTRLVQVFANLLNNAAKYSEPGSRVSLVAQQYGNEVSVSVRDTGAGIPPDMLPRIFDLFMQVDRTQEHSQGGLGIGLTLVRRLVEMHGGTVTARSAGRGHGSEFIVRLPVTETPG